MISIVYDRKQYHDLLAKTIQPSDTVIEIGPHLGKATDVISDKAKKTIAVDKALQAAEALRDRKDVTFVKGDVRFFETVDEVLKLTKKCDVLAVDMGGGRFPDTVFKVWAVWSGVFKPRDSILRNRGLGEFIKRARIDDASLNKEFPESGWLSQSGRKRPKQLKEGLEELQHWLKS
jgi:hypothetical protein